MKYFSFICIIVLLFQCCSFDQNPDSKKLEALKTLGINVDSLDEKEITTMIAIVERVRIFGGVADSQHKSMTYTIDGIEGTISRYNEIQNSIDSLRLITYRNGTKRYPEKDSFFIYSQMSKIDSNLIIPGRQGYRQTLRDSLIAELNEYHKTKFVEVKKRESINDQQFLNKYVAGKWRITNTLLYRDTIIPNQRLSGSTGQLVFTKFDLGAVCPPVCP